MTTTPTALANDAHSKPNDEADSQHFGSNNNNNSNDDIYEIYGVKRQAAGTRQELHNTKARALATAALAAATATSSAEMPLEVNAVVNA